MTVQVEKFIDPKNQMLQGIVEQDKLMTIFMLNHEETKAAHIMALLIREIDPTADKSLAADMEQLKKDLTLSNYDTLNDEDVNIVFEFIHLFLNRTYYKGWGGPAAPKENRPSGKL